MQSARHLSLHAGPFRVALPLSSVRQILDAGGPRSTAPTDPRALGVMPVPLAEVLGAKSDAAHPALLLFDGYPGPVVLSCDGLRGVVAGAEVRPLPATVITRWPGLCRGTLRSDRLQLVLDAEVLIGVVEAFTDGDAR